MAYNSLICLNDYEEKAQQLLGKKTVDYFATGADDEQTVKENMQDFKRLACSI